MTSPRWTKIARDLWLARGRMLMMVAAIAAGVAGVGTLLDAYTVLTREVNRNYMDTRPASASLEVDAIDDALLAQVRVLPGIAAAEVRATGQARVQSPGGQWYGMKAFIVPDFRAMEISRFFPNSGAWPAPDGAILLEREAATMLDAKDGATLQVKDGEGQTHAVVLAGTVHDPSLAPAGQEQAAYTYMTPATAAALGDIHLQAILKIMVAGDPMSEQSITRIAGQTASWLRARGHTVHAIYVPPPGKHPHQGQMSGMLLMLLMFGVLALVVSAILSATMVNAMLAQQVRQIGVMKTVGARSWQIARLYLGAVAASAVLACAIGIPLGAVAGDALSGAVARLLNFTLASRAAPHWVYLVQFAAGTLVPLAFTLPPVRRASRITVRAAIDDTGVGNKDFGRHRIDALLGRVRGVDRTLLLALRNMFRRRGRLLLTVGLLATAGALFIASLDVTAAWKRNIAMSADERHYDLEVALNHAQDAAAVMPLLRGLPGVRAVEAWDTVAASRPRADGQSIERTYPDGGHGSLDLRAAPAGSTMLALPVLAGRWLAPGSGDEIVLNPGARARFPEARVGQPLMVDVEGRAIRLQVVGMVREILSPAQGFVSPHALALAGGLPDGQVALLRVALDRHDTASRAGAAALVERRLEQAGVGVRRVITESALDTALNGHVFILIFNLVAISVVMALVGVLGLGSSMATAVVERTREIGIMRAIGARGPTLMRNILGEGLATAGLSWVAAVLLSLPLSAALGDFLGRASFGMPLPFVVSSQASALWLALVLAGALMAGYLPARRAAALPVRVALAHA